MKYRVGVPQGPIVLEAWYIVQYWDNWGIENNQYVEPTEREYRLHSGPYGDYLGAVLALMKAQGVQTTANYDIMEGQVTGTVQGFDPNNF